MTLPLFLLPDMAYAADVATRLDAIVVGVSFANDTQGYASMVTVADKNIAAFDKEPAEYVRMAKDCAVNV